MGECPTSGFGGGGGIRTLGGLHLTRFRGVLLRPLGHATARQRTGPASPDPANERLRLGGLGGSNAERRSSEELLQQRRAFRLEDAADDLRSMVVAAVAHEVPHRTSGPGLGVPGAEHQPVDPGEDDCAGAHHAGLAESPRVCSP